MPLEAIAHDPMAYRFFDYPMPLFILCLVVLAIPLVLILLKSPKAARWNIFMLRTSSILLMVRIVSALLFQRP